MSGVITRDGDQWTWVFTIGTSRYPDDPQRIDTLAAAAQTAEKAGFAEFSVMDHYGQGPGKLST